MSMFHTSKQLKQLAYIIIFFYLFVLQLYFAFPFTVDDAYISLRYAEHLAAGHGLAWNVGELPIEGYSNFGYVLLEVLFIKLHIPPLLSIKLFSCLSLLASFYVLILLSRFFLNQPLSYLPSFMMLLYHGEIFWAVGGLETTFYQLLVLLTVFFILKGLKLHKKNAFFFAGILNGFASLTRPEAPMLFLLFASGLVIASIRMDAEHRRRIKLDRFSMLSMFSFFQGFLLIFIPYFLWRWHYFGLLFSNSVYCKAFFKEQFAVLDMNYLSLCMPFIVLALPIIVLRRNIKQFFLITPSIAYLTALLFAHPVVAMFNRLFLPAFVLLLPLSVKGVSAFFELFDKRVLKQNQTYTLFLISSLFVALLLPSMWSLMAYNRYARSTFSTTEKRKDIAVWLKSQMHDNDAVLIGDCGVMPYTLKSTVIDSYCLNSFQIAHSPIDYSTSRFIDWVLGNKKPKFMVLLNYVKDTKVSAPLFETMLYQRTEFKENYRLVKTFPFSKHSAQHFFYTIYESKENNYA